MLTAREQSRGHLDSRNASMVTTDPITQCPSSLNIRGSLSLCLALQQGSQPATDTQQKACNTSCLNIICKGQTAFRQSLRNTCPTRRHHHQEMYIHNSCLTATNAVLASVITKPPPSQQHDNTTHQTAEITHAHPLILTTPAQWPAQAST